MAVSGIGIRDVDSARTGLGITEEGQGQLNPPRAEIFAQTLSLRVESHRRSHAFAQKTDNNEVQRLQVRQLVPTNFQSSSFRHQLPEPLRRQILLKPGVT